ncbi:MULTISPECIES: hypothetical protein [Caulobacter]|jgi:hypothetical protein|uniref:Uncharacterized protein n=1 Tax=Caulobacter vibrioides OR37 TaxID=1292034 RepID=R0CQX2_CAUVI|nr:MULTISPECIES: hypothetical protein [Caulobacter]ENZ79021.1 hypothetical protein OR37_04005 [Caulobacter vibrioides OR37]MBQ1562634.1 hypothetical protein [Caulobacter sp.]
MTDIDNGWDEQDGAEALDEDVVGRDGELRTFEELPDVLDVTQAEGDADDDDALTAEDLTDDEIVELEQEDDPGDGRDVDDRRPEVFDGE